MFERFTNWVRKIVTDYSLPALVGMAVTIIFATALGVFAAVALGVGSQTPTKTVTINVGTGSKGDTGPQGPPGPPGPKGEPGATNCPAGSTFGEVVFIQQGQGPTTLLGCIKD